MPDRLEWQLRRSMPKRVRRHSCDYLLDLRLRGKISSNDVCLLSWLASKGGLGGRAGQLSFRPGAPSGHYQRHLDTVTEMCSKCNDAYLVEVPSEDAAHNWRFKLSVPILPLHESLNLEVESDEHIREIFLNL